MSRLRRYFTAEKKAQVVRRHLVGKVAVSDLADELGVQPSQIHTWVKQVLDQAEKAFERSSGPRRGNQAKEAKIEVDPIVWTAKGVELELVGCAWRPVRPP